MASSTHTELPERPEQQPESCRGVFPISTLNILAINMSQMLYL